MNCVKRCDLLTCEDSEVISKTVLDLEGYVKRLGDDIYIGTSDDSLTGRYYCFNFLSNEVIGSILKPKLRELFGRPVVVQCWANIFRKGEGIAEHKHEVSEDENFFGSANIFLHGDPTIGTYYEDVKSVNKIGEFVIFPVTMKHSVPPNPTDNIRVSMAFDFYVGHDELMSKMVATDPRRFIIV
jgi:hypothetical protein